MRRRDYLKTAAGGLVAAIGRPGLAAVPEKRPNLLIVFPDQMRGQALGFLNEDPVVTPRLDRFAQESLVLPDAVSNYPVCSPFRAMLMSGQYPFSNGVLGNCSSTTEPYGCELHESTRCWSDVLKEHGYSLGYIGKWHLDAPRDPYIQCSNNAGAVKWNEWCSPERRHGFDYWYAYGTYDMHLNPMYWTTYASRDGFQYVKQWGPEHEADKAIEFIQNKDKQRDADKPFALVVSMNPPHTPYNQVPEKYLSVYKNKSDKELLVRPDVDRTGTSEMSQLALSQTRNYFACITGVDEQFGRILDALEATGVDNETIVLFTSDHGDCIGSHNQPTKNNHYEESMRVPFLIRWPGNIPPRRDPLLISSPDIYPTLLDLMGLAPAIPNAVQGQSYASLFLTGQGARPSSQLYMRPAPQNPARGLRGVRTDRYKLMVDRTPGRPDTVELYDRKDDPYEMKNIADEHPETVAALMSEEMIPQMRKMDDPWVLQN